MPTSKRKERYREIGRELRRMFDDVINEPLPDNLRDLVKRFEEKDGGDTEKDA